MNTLYFVLIEVKQKLDQCVKIQILLILCQSNKSKYQTMLLLNLINNDILRPILPKFIVKDSRRYLHKQKHIQKDKHDKINSIRLVLLKSQVMVVRVVSVSCQDVCLEDHHRKRRIISHVLVWSVESTLFVEVES